MDSNFELSRYVKCIDRKDGVLIYHTLFGNPILISESDYLKLVKTNDIEDGMFNNPIFEYLKKNFFIHPKGYEEYKIIAEEIKDRETKSSTGYLFRQLQLIMTRSCNFRCTYCYERDMNIKNSGNLKNDSNNSMSFTVADKAINNALHITKKHDNELFIEFFGGEPLINWKVIKQILDKFENGEKFHSHIFYSITTNGSLINKEIADYFKRYNVNITISLDSLENEQRVYANGESTSQNVLSKISFLNKNGNYVTINSTISKETYDSFNGRELVDFSVANNIQMIGLILDLDVNTYNNKEYRDKVIDAVIDTYIYGHGKGIKIVGYWHQIFSQIIGKQLLALVTGYKTCPATGCKLSIEPDGRIFVCKGPLRKVGHIDDFENCFVSSDYKDYVRSLYKTEGNCRYCELEGFCSGVCMGSLEKKYNNIYRVEDSTCLVYRELITKLLRIYEIN
jgi:uncharacterized protein